jgi:hypothetical protein
MTERDLVRTGVTDRLSDGINTARQRRSGYDASAPHTFQQIVPADDTITIADEVDRRVENLRADPDQFVTATQLAMPNIDGMILKYQAHNAYLPMELKRRYLKTI